MNSTRRARQIQTIQLLKTELEKPGLSAERREELSEFLMDCAHDCFMDDMFEPDFLNGIILIRHGESMANAGERTRTPSGIPLSPLGREQARDLEHAALDPELIVVSAYLRTQETAAPLCQRLSDVPVETWPVHEFTYLAPEHYINTTEQDRHAPVARYWERADPQHRDGPGAETFAEFIARVDAILERLRSMDDPQVCIFTHSFFILALLWRQMRPGAVVDERFMREYDIFRRAVRIEHARPIPFRIIKS